MVTVDHVGREATTQIFCVATTATTNMCKCMLKDIQNLTAKYGRQTFRPLDKRQHGVDINRVARIQIVTM